MVDEQCAPLMASEEFVSNKRLKPWMLTQTLSPSMGAAVPVSSAGSGHEWSDLARSTPPTQANCEWGCVPLGMLAWASAGQTPQDLLAKLMGDESDLEDQEETDDDDGTESCQTVLMHSPELCETTDKETAVRQCGAKSLGS